MAAGYKQNYRGVMDTNTFPCKGGAAVVPHDTNELAFVTRALYVGGAGALAITMDDGTEVIMPGVTAGSWLFIRVRRVKVTGTAATLISAFW